MADNTEIAVVLKLVADSFQSELKKSQGLLGDFSRFISDWKTQLTAAGGALFAVAKTTADYNDGLDKLAQKLGTTAQFLAGLQYAAKLADVEVDQLSGSLGQLDKSLVQAAQGDQAKIQAFEALGISATDTHGQIKPLETILLELNEKFQAMPDGPVKTGLAMQIMGRSAREVLPLFNSDMGAAIEKAKQLGIVMSQQDIQASREFNENLHQLQAMARSLTNSLGNETIPIFNQLLQILITLKSQSGEGGFSWTKAIQSQLILANGLLKEFIANLKAAKELENSGTQAGGVPKWALALPSVKALSLLASGITVATNPEGAQGGILADLKKQIADIEAETTQKLFILQHPGAAALLQPAPKRGAGGDGDGQGKPDSQKKSLEARKAVLEAEQQLNKARIQAWETHQADFQRLLDADRSLFTAHLAYDGEALGYSKVNANTERDLLQERLAQQQDYLDKQKLGLQEELRLMQANQAAQAATLKAKTADEATHAKTTAEKKDIQEAGRLELEALQKKAQAEQLPIQAKLQTLSLDKQIADLTAQTQTLAINRAMQLAAIDNERAQAQLNHTNTLADIDERRTEGQLTAADALKHKLEEEASYRQQLIDLETKAAAFRSVNDAEFQKAADAMARMKVEHEQKSALETRQIAHAAREQDLKEAVTVAQSKEDVLKITSFDMAEIAAAHVETLRAQYAHDLENFQGTEQEKVAYKRLKEAELQQATALASGNVLEIYRYGLQQYLTNTDNTFNIAVDMARTTAQGMEQGFQSFFFDALNNKFHSLTDVLTSVRNFALQIVSQVAAKMATAGLLEYIGPVISNLGATNPQGLNTSGQFTTTVQPGPGSGLGHFATGGSFMVGGMGGVDSKLIQFFASPGERVDITTPEQQAAKAGGLFQPVSVENKTEIYVSNQHPGAEVQTSKSQGSGGQQIIQFVITQVKQALAAGEFDRTLQSNFGLSRQGVAR